MTKATRTFAAKSEAAATDPHGLRPGQSVALLQALHILTRDGRMNQDSRRKLKQVYHLYQFIEPLLLECLAQRADITLVDHGAGKSYLGFILYDLFFKTQAPQGRIWGVEARPELVESAQALAARLGFAGMAFLNHSVADAAQHLPERIDIVTALHACDTATDDAIAFGLACQARHIVVVPCCQAELAAALRARKAAKATGPAFTELWRHALHTREFGSQLTNVLRGLQLEAHGYQVTVTELVGWEHSLKNEIILARRPQNPLPPAQTQRAAQRLGELLDTVGLRDLRARYLGEAGDLEQSAAPTPIAAAALKPTARTAG